MNLCQGGDRMKKMILTLFVSLALVILYPCSAICSETVDLEVEMVNKVKIVSGGIGLEERQALKAMEKDFILKIVFAVLQGQYLSNIPLMIRNSGGKELLSTDSKGPWFMANLPPGNYEITAVYKNQKKKQTVTIGDKLNIVMFHWKPGK